MIKFHDKTGRILSFSETIEKAIVRIENIYLDFVLFFLRIAGHVPFHTVRIFLYKLCRIKIGRGSIIHMWANFFDPKNIKIGSDTIIGDHSFLDGRDLLSIGNHVDIASSVMIYNSQHDINSPDFKAISKPVNIKDYVFIGPRSIILPGVTIGKGAVVAAGAVVTHDVKDFKIVAGVPANEIGERTLKKLSYKLGRARLFQ